MTDARTGFHDIKPLPEFSPIPWTMVILVLTALLIILLATLAWKKHKSKQTVSTQPPEPAIVSARRDISSLLKKDAASSEDVRIIAETLSLILRSYLAKRLLFPAIEQTSYELKNSFPKQLAKRLPLLSRDSITENSRALHGILRYCEQVAFGLNTEISFKKDVLELREQAKVSLSLIEKIETLLNKEQDRISGVIAQSKLAESQDQTERELSTAGGRRR